MEKYLNKRWKCFIFEKLLRHMSMMTFIFPPLEVIFKSQETGYIVFQQWSSRRLHRSVAWMSHFHEIECFLKNITKGEQSAVNKRKWKNHLNKSRRSEARKLAIHNMKASRISWKVTTPKGSRSVGCGDKSILKIWENFVKIHFGGKKR